MAERCAFYKLLRIFVRAYPIQGTPDIMTKATDKERSRADKFLQKYHIQPNDVMEFSFMRRPEWAYKRPFSKGAYGPGLLTLYLADESSLSDIVHIRNHPSALINTLLEQDIPFVNLQHKRKPTQAQVHESFNRPSLYMFWFFTVFIVSAIMEFWVLSEGDPMVAGVFGVVFGLMCGYSLFLLLTHFCYVTLEKDAMEVHSVGRTIRYPYATLRKVNFDFAREPNATHVMELLEQVGEGDTSFMRYHLHYIGRVPRTRLSELADKLSRQGVDATCSLNDEKRHYHDTMHYQHN